MKIKPYWDYLKYLLNHKKNVFIECWNEGLYLHAFTHDLSKFLPCEFIPYARYFYIDKEKYEDDFEKAWIHHYRYNKHHWNYWGYCWVNTRDFNFRIKMDNPAEMKDKYIRQMICDWKAMSRKFGNIVQN